MNAYYPHTKRRAILHFRTISGERQPRRIRLSRSTPSSKPTPTASVRTLQLPSLLAAQDELHPFTSATAGRNDPAWLDTAR
ncbi:hypothetical protein M408DRAFT_30740 [Serendipita vermifera MAFF 305830]|uniref:Uncharacterized protein n=1 Tax=Serendipita vermifera MAFF 305830 TaxID=933852 RepID=A0A0C3AIX2_SERVB|nr:hypothetical protein M408DRAFT_30740 [Serendipita vermifera MAFF 305830]